MGLIKVLPPKQTQVIYYYESELDAHLDAVAQSHGFADRTRLALRAAYPNKWRKLAIAYGTWMDDCNDRAAQRLARVQAGQEPAPTINQFLADLPVFIAPADA